MASPITANTTHPANSQIILRKGTGGTPLSHDEVDGNFITLMDGHNDVVTALGTKAASSHTHSSATASSAGFMSTSDKSKLDNIASSANNYSLPNATSSVLGGVKVGTGISVSSGTISVSNATTSANGLMSSSDKSKLNGIASSANNYSLPTASSSVLGGVKVGSNLSISNGVLSANTQSGTYSLPTATSSTLGGVKIGNGINISSGVISVKSNDSALNVASTGLTLDKATTGGFGVVKVGSGISVSNGVISVSNTSYTLPTASASTLGGIKVGSGLSISSGVLSATGTSIDPVKLNPNATIDYNDGSDPKPYVTIGTSETNVGLRVNKVGGNSANFSVDPFNDSVAAYSQLLAQLHYEEEATCQFWIKNFNGRTDQAGALISLEHSMDSSEVSADQQDKIAQATRFNLDLQAPYGRLALGWPFATTKTPSLNFEARSGNLYPVSAGTEGQNLGESFWDLDPVYNSYAWKNVYVQAGAINGSDERLKQDIADLDETEKRVAVAAKGLVKKYRLKQSVATKGEKARLHIGVIAQELIAAFEAEGLNAFDYSLVGKSVKYIKRDMGVEPDTITGPDGEPSENPLAGEKKPPLISDDPITGAADEEKIETLHVRYHELLAFIISAL